ncbi:MAG: hypothetical protein U0736_14880 [Gemmataceae bacterium]
MRKGLTAASPRVRRAALAALDGMAGGNLQADEVARELNAADAGLRARRRGGSPAGGRPGARRSPASSPRDWPTRSYPPRGRTSWSPS